MKSVVLIAGVLAVGLAAASPGNAQQLRYWGKQPEAATGWIDLGRGQYHEISVGTEIAEWGRVKEVRDDRLVVELVLTEAERLRLDEKGALVHDAFEIHVLREDLRHPHSGGAPSPPQ